MLPCHSFQIHGAWITKEVGEGFKVIFYKANHKQGTGFMGGVHSSSHYGRSNIPNKAHEASEFWSNIWSEKGNAASSYCPIACLPLTWKLMISCFAEKVYAHLSEKNVLPD